MSDCTESNLGRHNRIGLAVSGMSYLTFNLRVGHSLQLVQVIAQIGLLSVAFVLVFFGLVLVSERWRGSSR